MPERSDLNLAHLRTFCIMMAEGSYAAAARVSDMSVPTVWQHIHALEKAYGVELFQRSGRSVQPSSAAYKLFELVESILVQIDSTYDLIAGSSVDASIRIVAGARMMLEDLAAPLAAFQRTHRAHLVIRQGNDRLAEQLLLEDQADLALALEPGLKQKSPRIHYEPAYTVDFLAVAKKSHPFMKSRSCGLAELAEHDLVVTQVGSHGRDALDQAFYRDGLTARIIAETDNSAFTIACANAGMGIGILAGRSAGELCRKLAVRSLDRYLGRRRIVLMWRRGRLLSNAMVDFVERVKQLVP